MPDRSLPRILGESAPRESSTDGGPRLDFDNPGCVEGIVGWLILAAASLAVIGVVWVVARGLGVESDGDGGGGGERCYGVGQYVTVCTDDP